MLIMEKSIILTTMRLLGREKQRMDVPSLEMEKEEAFKKLLV